MDKFAGLRLGDCFLVAAGSGLGGVARYVLSLWLMSRFPSAFPWGILWVNVTGCLLLGLLMGWIAGRGDFNAWRLFLGVGFLGGYTTFSTLLYDTWRLGGRLGLANLGLSAAAGFLATALGHRIVRFF